MTPRITIITVCYNAEQTIPRTLRSIQAQTYSNIEYLVIDGASKDGTLELVQKLAPRANVFSEPDKGIYDAMNKGLKHATGEYIWYVNAGDALPSPSTVEDLVSLACVDHLPDVIYGDTRLIDDKEQDLGLRRLRPPRELTWQSFRSGMLVCHQAFIAKRHLAPTFDLHYRFSADVDWCIRILKEAKDCFFLPYPIALYLSEGTTTANHRASLLERFDVMRRHYGLLPTLYQHLRFLFVRQR
ncbi:MAG: glycosyltransferase [Porphyromonadaceae bacterium]|nr:glycosyltransferase [Porphyromonadaceae bacterium]